MMCCTHGIGQKRACLMVRDALALEALPKLTTRFFFSTEAGSVHLLDGPSGNRSGMVLMLWEPGNREKRR